MPNEHTREILDAEGPARINPESHTVHALACYCNAVIHNEPGLSRGWSRASGDNVTSGVNERAMDLLGEYTFMLKPFNYAMDNLPVIVSVYLVRNADFHLTILRDRTLMRVLHSRSAWEVPQCYRFDAQVTSPSACSKAALRTISTRRCDWHVH